MKGAAAIHDLLRAAIASEFRASSQYALHAGALDNWGYGGLAKHERQEAKEEQGHARRFIERLTFLEGELDIGPIAAPDVGMSVPEVLALDLKAERAAVAMYTASAMAAWAEGDLVTSDLFRSILADEQGHVNWLETQLAGIDAIGLQGYLQTQFGGAA